MRPVFLQYLIVAVTSVASLVSTASPSTSSPTVIISDIQQADPAVFCIDCGEPFDAHTRRKILKRLANNPYIAQLRKGLYFPDSAQPFVSKVHFDNCDFDAGLDHLASLMDEVASYARAAEATTDNAERDDAVSHAFFALGQALHSIQDFYAHSNYVELQMAKVQRDDRHRHHCAMAQGRSPANRIATKRATGVRGRILGSSAKMFTRNAFLY